MPEHDLSEIVAIGARITYLVVWNNATSQYISMGERPHCLPWYMVPNAEAPCPAKIGVTNEGGGETFSEQCTRELKHPGPHVVHSEPGLPVLAWLEDPRVVAPDPVAVSNAAISKFYETHPRTDAEPEWDDLTPGEQRSTDPERFQEESE
jgi:hypothetical protein